MPDQTRQNSRWEFPQLLVMSGILVIGLAFIPAATEHYLLKASVIQEEKISIEKPASEEIHSVAPEKIKNTLPDNEKNANEKNSEKSSGK